MSEKELIRDNFVFVFIGFNRTGKTSDALSIIKAWRESHKKGQVISFDPQRRLTEVTDENIYTESDLTSFREEMRTLFVFDDYKGLLSKDKLPEDLMYMFIQREEYCNDFIFITHAPNLVLERLTYYVSHYFLYYTQSKAKGFRDKIPDYETLTLLRNIINNYVKIHGKGEYPDFPCIIYDNSMERVTLKNMQNLKIESYD